MARSFGEQVVVVASVAFLVLGLTLNEKVLAYFFTGDGSFGSGRVRIAIAAFDATMVAVAIAVFALRRTPWGPNLALLASSFLLASPVCAEAVLRTGIALGLPAFRDPWLYAGWCDDEDFWKLRYRWSDGDVWGDRLAHDPLLGWTLAAPADDCRPCDRPVLLYGDSFMAGVEPTPAEERIPQWLARELGDGSIVDLAVPGYGLDQMLLRFRDTRESHDRPWVVVGLMTLDLDRSLLAVRDAPKPYFRLTGGALELAGVPVPDDTAAWHARHPVSIRSYLLRLLRRRLTLRGETLETEAAYLRDEKSELGRKLLEAFAAEAKEGTAGLLVVIFYPPWQLGIEGWRERFLHAELGRLEVPFVDTKALLRESAERNRTGVAAFYHPDPNHHLNSEGNRLVALEVARRLESARGDS